MLRCRPRRAAFWWLVVAFAFVLGVNVGGRRRGTEVAHRVFAWARIRCEYLSWGGQRHEVGVAGSPGASPPRCHATLSPLRFVFDAWGRGGDVVVVR